MKEIDALVFLYHLCVVAQLVRHLGEIFSCDFIVYKVNFKKNRDKKLEQDYNKEEFIVVFSSDELGIGDEEFSKKLLEGFVYSLSEKDQVPTYVVL